MWNTLVPRQKNWPFKFRYYRWGRHFTLELHFTLDPGIGSHILMGWWTARTKATHAHVTQQFLTLQNIALFWIRLYFIEIVVVLSKIKAQPCEKSLMKVWSLWPNTTHLAQSWGGILCWLAAILHTTTTPQHTPSYCTYPRSSSYTCCAAEWRTVQYQCWWQRSTWMQVGAWGCSLSQHFKPTWFVRDLVLWLYVGILDSYDQLKPQKLNSALQPIPPFYEGL